MNSSRAKGTRWKRTLQAETAQGQVGEIEDPETRCFLLARARYRDRMSALLKHVLESSCDEGSNQFFFRDVVIMSSWGRAVSAVVEAPLSNENTSFKPNKKHSIEQVQEPDRLAFVVIKRQGVESQAIIKVSALICAVSPV